MTLCSWSSSLCKFSIPYCLFFFRVTLNYFTLKKKALRCLETSGNTPPRDTTSHPRRLQLPAVALKYLQVYNSAEYIRGGSDFVCVWKLDSWGKLI